MHRLIYIDDERTASSGYREKLDAFFEVHYYITVPSYRWLEEQLVALGPRLIVQDVMLPPPGSDEGIIDNHVGINILREARETIIQLDVKVVVFSNRMIDELEEEVRDLEFPEGLVRVLYKPNTGFADLVRECCGLVVI